MASLPAGYRRPVLGLATEMRAALATEALEKSAGLPEGPPAEASKPSSAAKDEQRTFSRGMVTVNTLKLPVFQGGENGLVIETDSEIPLAPELQVLGNSVYALRLKNTRLSPGALLTSLFPSGSGTLGSVRSVQQGNDAVLKIFCAGETPLKVRYSGKTAVIGTEDVVAAYSSPKN